MSKDNIGGGLYVQVAGLGISVGWNSAEGLIIAPFAQGAVVVAGIASAGVSIDPRDILSEDPQESVLDWTSTLAVGVGTPPGVPTTGVIVKDVRTGENTVQTGFGIGDIFEFGFYGTSYRGEGATLSGTDPTPGDRVRSAASELDAALDHMGVVGDVAGDVAKVAANAVVSVAETVVNVAATAIRTMLEMAVEDALAKNRLAIISRFEEWEKRRQEIIAEQDSDSSDSDTTNTAASSSTTTTGDGDSTGPSTGDGGSSGTTTATPGTDGGSTTTHTSTTSSSDADGSSTTTTTTDWDGSGNQTTTTTTTTVSRDRQDVETSTTTTTESDPTATEGRRPVLLDLDGNGVTVTEFSKSSAYLDGGDGKEHRTAWAGSGDGVLFYDAGNDNKITEQREFVFTEWSQGSTSDFEALREAFDTNGDGRLTSADAQWGSFKVMVTNADGTVTARTLAELGITSIDLRPDATNIELPDGSVITGQSTFLRNGVARIAADTTLSMDAEGHRVVRAVTGPEGVWAKKIVNTGYDEDGGIAFRQVTLAKTDGSHVRHLFDTDGDGVTDRRQDIKVVQNADGSRTERVVNRVSDETAAGDNLSVTDRTVTTTTADGKQVTILRDLNGGGHFEEREVRVTTGTNTVVTVDTLGPTGQVLASLTKTQTLNGMVRVESFDSDGAGASLALKSSVAIVADAAGARTETREAQDSTGKAYARTVKVTSADGRNDTVTQWLDRDRVLDANGNQTLELVSTKTVAVTGTGIAPRVTVTEVKNANGSLVWKSTGTVSADARDKTVAVDADGDGDVDVTTRDVTTFDAAGARTQVQTAVHADGTGNFGRQTVIQADGVRSKTWVDMDGNGSLAGGFTGNELVREVVLMTTPTTVGSAVNAANVRQETVWSRAGSAGVVTGSSMSLVTEDGLHRVTRADLDGDSDIDRVVRDTTEVTAGGSVRTVVTRAGDETFLSKSVTTSSADGLRQETETTVQGVGQDIVTKTSLMTAAEGSATQQTYKEWVQGNLVKSQVVTQSENRRRTTVETDTNGDGQVDSRVVREVENNGDVTTVTRKLGVGGVEISEVVEAVSRNGQDIWTRNDLDGDGDFDVEARRTSEIEANGATRIVTTVQSRDDSIVSRVKEVVSADGLVRKSFSNLDTSTERFERSSHQVTRIEADGTRVTTTENSAWADLTTEIRLNVQQVRVSDDGLKTEVLSDTDVNGAFERFSESVTVTGLEGGLPARVTTVKTGLAATTNDPAKIHTTTQEVLWNNGQNREQRFDVNGDGKFDTVVKTTVAVDGKTTETRLEMDRSGGLLASAQTLTSANGLRVSTTVDMDGDGNTDATTVELTTLNADGSTKRTISNYGRNVNTTYDDNGGETLNSKTTIWTESNGHKVTVDQDLDGEFGVDLRTITVRRIENNGDEVTIVTRNTGEGTTKIGQEITTVSRTGRSVKVENDLDGNGKIDVVRSTKINADGTKTERVNFLSTGEVKVAGMVTTTSANGFESRTLKDTNGDDEVDLVIRQIKVLENDGDTRISTTVDNNRNERLGSMSETRSMDGLHASTSLDWDGRDGIDFRSTSDRAYNPNGDIVDTMITLDALANVRSTIVSTTSGNGLERYVTTDFNGDGSVDRITDSKTAANGSSVMTLTEFTPGLDTRRETTITTRADGRESTTEIDLNGDGFIDRQSTSHIDLDRDTRTEYAEVLLNGELGDRIVETKNFNGTVHRFQFDVGGGGAPDFARETTVSYGSAGQKITTFTESYGDRVVYVSTSSTSQNELRTTVNIDTDGNGTNDAVTQTLTQINQNGSRTTTSETKYTKEFDNDVRSSSWFWVSADGRETRSRMDYDGNGIDDKTSLVKIGSDGSRMETERTYEKAGAEIGETVTETSADGLITTITREGNRQVIIRSAVSDASYVWKGGKEVGYEKSGGSDVYSGGGSVDTTGGGGSTINYGSASNVDTNYAGGSYTSHVRTLTQKEVIHDVDAFGIEVWRFYERETVNDVLTTTLHMTRVDAEAKARLIAEAARIYDTVLDRGMDFFETQVLVKFVNNGELNRLALVEELMTSDEFQTRYGTMSRAEFINQIFHNTFGRGATLAEASALMAVLDDGTTRAIVARDLAETLEHVIVGNGHMSTNNFDVIMNPAVFERSLDRAFAHEQVRRLVDIVYDRNATDNELSVLSARLMGGTQTLGDIAQLLLDTEGRIFGGRVTAVTTAMSSTVFVRNVFENAFGRVPTETEELRWVNNLEQGRISKAGMIVLLANSVDHVADGNGAMPGAAVTAAAVQTGNDNIQTLTGTVNQDDLRGLGGNDTMLGGDGADRLVGGLGADSASGGRGQDRYIWVKGDGSDTIDDNDVSQITTDTLFMQDVLPAEIELERSGNHLLIKIIGGATITIKDRFQDATKGLGIEVIQFDGGSQWDLRRILNETKSIGIIGSDYRDNLRGNASANVLEGRDGRDTLTGAAGDDTLNGGAGGDRYVWTPGDGNDIIIEGGDGAGVIDVLDMSSVLVGRVFDIVRINGTKDIRIYLDNAGGPTIVVQNQFNDTVVGGGIEQIIFSDDVWTLHDIVRKSNFNGGATSTALIGSNYDDLMTGGDGNDTLTSGYGDDTLFGEDGADFLQGGYGGDLYRWSRGHGADTINDFGNRGAGDDILDLEDVRSDFITFARDNGSEHLQIRIMITDPQNSARQIVGTIITALGFFSESVVGSGIDRIILSDGVIWDRDDILDRAVVYGGDSGVALNGTRYRDRLSGGGGADALDGKDGADTLLGGQGDDTLRGGSGSDVYFWNPNLQRGDDRIIDMSDRAGDVDTLRLMDVDSRDVTILRSDDDMLVKVKVGATIYTIRDVDRFDQSGNGGIEIIQFDNGETIRIRGSNLAVIEWNGTDGHDTKRGWNYGDIIDGKAGSDTLHGGDWGTDTLIGGKGLDVLNGLPVSTSIAGSLAMATTPSTIPARRWRKLTASC
jgi:Ca2+-binding RTX toxin-like protein